MMLMFYMQIGVVKIRADHSSMIGWKDHMKSSNVL